MNRYIFNAGDLVSIQGPSDARGMLGIVRRASYSAYEPKYNRYEVIWLDGQWGVEEAWRLKCVARRSKPSDGPLAHPTAFDVSGDGDQGRATGEPKESARERQDERQGTKE
jgi:hypothetical protein